MHKGIYAAVIIIVLIVIAFWPRTENAAGLRPMPGSRPGNPQAMLRKPPPLTYYIGINKKWTGYAEAVNYPGQQEKTELEFTSINADGTFIVLLTSNGNQRNRRGMWALNGDTFVFNFPNNP
jgi:hypothetical protein